MAPSDSTDAELRAELPTLSQPFDLSKGLAAAQKKLNERIEALSSDWQARDVSSADLANKQLGAGSAAAFTEATKHLLDLTLNLLLREKELRGDIASHLGQVDDELASRRNAAIDAHQAAERDVRDKLISIGYVEGILPGSDRPSIMPGYLQTHPRVFNAKCRRDALESASNNPLRDLNQNGLEVVDRSIERIRGRLMAV